jgi:anti-sigma28 factor (negative regulator of flagellin synthesis)
MKINDSNINGLASSGIGKAQEADVAGRTRGKGAGGADSSTDRVELSSLSASLRAEDSESPERAAYIEQLAADYEAGQYNPDALEVSKKIIADALREPAKE